MLASIPLRAAILGGFRVRQLFSAGQQGIWLDPSDFTSLYQDSEGTTPVTAVEQPVGRILDKSGRGNHPTQSTATARPKVSARTNFLRKTQQVTDAAVWNATGLTGTLTDGEVAPDGSLTASRVAWTSGFIFQISEIPGAANQTVSVSVKVKAVSSATQVMVRIDRNGFAQGNQVARNINALTWTDVELTATLDTATASPVFRLDRVDGEVVIAWPRINAGPSIYAKYQRVTTATDYDTVGFPHYLQFDGVDDFLATPSINFTGTDKMTVWAGVHKASDTANQVLLELSSVADTTNPGSFALHGSGDGGGSAFSASLSVTGSTWVGFGSAAAPTTRVLCVAYDIAQAAALDEITPRMGGNVQAETLLGPGPAGAGNFGNYPLYIGRRGGVSLPLNGRLYGLIVRGAASSASEIAAAERFTAGKSGVTLA